MDDYREIWNDICYRIKDKNQFSAEREFQIIAEFIFDKLGWSMRKNEIMTQKTIHIGASGNVRPDIIIADKEKYLFVVELKKPNVSISEQHAEQLFSYMRLLKVNFGIILGESIQIFYELPNSNEKPLNIGEISFIDNSEEGISFIKLLSKNEYSPEKIDSYCKERLELITEKERAQNFLNNLCSPNGVDVINKLLEDKLSSEFSENAIKLILENILINISKKGVIVRPAPQLPVIGGTNEENKDEKDYSKYRLDGKLVGGKGKLVLEVVKAYVRNNPDITLKEINNVFKGLLSEKLGFVDTYDNARIKFKGQVKEIRHFLKEPINLSEEQTIVVSNEWNRRNIKKFITRATNLGFKITKERS